MLRPIFADPDSGVFDTEWRSPGVRRRGERRSAWLTARRPLTALSSGARKPQ
jgi:hypothetical protein